MTTHTSNVNENFSITHGDELKDRRFYSNTVREYQVGSYLQKQNDYKDHLSLHVDFVQSKGDFSLGAAGYELKENSGSLQSGYLSFEILNTRQIEPSGIMASHKFGVKNFIMYLPEGKWVHSRYSKYKDKLYIFDTKELYEWLIKQEYIDAKNNRSAYSNAICYQVPIRYLSENIGFQKLIKETYTVTQSELNSFGTPEGVDSLFLDQ
jgi:hypothetical protein